MHHSVLIVLGNWEWHRGMLQNYPQSYEAFTEALALQPNNAELWLNRSMACRFTMRFGRALRDIEHAIKLNMRPEQERYDEAENSIETRTCDDPEYTIAKNNLASTSRDPEGLGPPEIVKLNQPFKDSKMKQSIHFIRE